MKQPKLPPFAPLPKAVINSPAFKSLQHVDVRILVVLLSKFNGYNNGAIAFGVREAAHECRCSQATACRGFDRLQKAGLIECTYKGHTVPEPGRPDAPSRWRITFLENVQPKERKFHAAS